MDMEVTQEEVAGKGGEKAGSWRRALGSEGAGTCWVALSQGGESVDMPIVVRAKLHRGTGLARAGPDVAFAPKSSSVTWRNAGSGAKCRGRGSGVEAASIGPAQP